MKGGIDMKISCTSCGGEIKIFQEKNKKGLLVDVGLQCEGCGVLLRW